MLMYKRHLFTSLHRWPSLSTSYGRQIKSTIRSHWMRMKISGLFIQQCLTTDFSHLPSRHWTPTPSAPSNTKLADWDTRKHFQAFLTHTSHPRAGWENRCQQSTPHAAGKEPDRTSNEQQAAHQPFTTARFPWYLQYNILHVAVCGPQRSAGLQVHKPVRGTLHVCRVALPLWGITESYTAERASS